MAQTSAITMPSLVGLGLCVPLERGQKADVFFFVHHAFEQQSLQCNIAIKPFELRNDSDIVL